jgi:hypothetical protein
MIGGRVPKRGWSRPFDDPIVLPGGRELVTLKDAGIYITKLPKAEHEAPEWQATAEALAASCRARRPTMLARIGIMRGIEPQHVREFFPMMGNSACSRSLVAESIRYGVNPRSGT